MNGETSTVPCRIEWVTIACGSFRSANLCIKEAFHVATHAGEQCGRQEAQYDEELVVRVGYVFIQRR